MTKKCYHCGVSKDQKEFKMSQLNVSARAYHRTQSVKLAHTIADLAGSEEVQSVEPAEVLRTHLHSATLRGPWYNTP
jgi:predicted ATPase with chaperone activity